ncbi:hypothetical protein BHM03_00047478 [Ensete ventricosum]|nr:hypothetical protein BHM03_00047478 [Ensete ventricosum]
MVTGSLSELEQRRPRTVGGVLELDTNPIAAEPPQPLSVEVQLYLKDKRDGVSPGGEINSAAGRDDVVGLGGEELGDGAPPRLLLVVRARHLVLEIELHSSSLSRRLCYPVDLKGRSERTEQNRCEKDPLLRCLPKFSCRWVLSTTVIIDSLFHYGDEREREREAEALRLPLAASFHGVKFQKTQERERCSDRRTGVAALRERRGGGRRGPQAQWQQRQQEKKQNRVFGLTPSSDGHPPHVRAPHERRRKGLRLLLICHKAAFASYLAMSSEAEHKEGVRRVLLP